MLLAALPAVISGATLAVAGWTARRVASFVRGFSAEHAALMESQRNQLKGSIVDRWERAAERGYVTAAELESANRMYDSYRALGGNHYVRALMEKMNSMEARGELPRAGKDGE